MRPYRRVVLGGTFDHLHIGHAALLGTALRLGDEVAIGLTTSAYLDRHPKPDGHRIQSFPERRARLVRWLRRHAARRRWTVVPLDDAFGGSVLPGVDALVVSAESRGGGRAVNRERRRRGLPRIPVHEVPLVLSDDLLPLSARRIRAGEVDANGRVRAPVELRVEVAEPRLRAPVLRGARAVLSRPRLARSPADARDRLTIRVRAEGRRWVVRLSRGRLRVPEAWVRSGDVAALERAVRAALRPPRLARANKGL